MPRTSRKWSRTDLIRRFHIAFIAINATAALGMLTGVCWTPNHALPLRQGSPRHGALHLSQVGRGFERVASLLGAGSSVPRKFPRQSCLTVPRIQSSRQLRGLFATMSRSQRARFASVGESPSLSTEPHLRSVKQIGCLGGDSRRTPRPWLCRNGSSWSKMEWQSGPSILRIPACVDRLRRAGTSR